MTGNSIISLAIGFGLALLCEAILATKRRQALSEKSSSATKTLMVMTFGFLGRLTALFLGAVVGKETGWYQYDLFLYSFVVGLLVGEVCFFLKIKRK
ncbi:MAG: hypothetical protein ACI84O_000653 [Myxococcota bacterium]|jgi:hypothetical protein